MAKLGADVLIVDFFGATNKGTLYMKTMVDVVNAKGKQVYALYELGYLQRPDGISANAVYRGEIE